jgi:hypothetical protein
VPETVRREGETIVFEIEAECNGERRRQST